MKLNDITFIIPARKGSKGFPGKNQVLFDYTADLLESLKKVIVTTDDDIIQEKALSKGFDVLFRSEELSSDTANMKDVLLDVIEKRKLREKEIIVLLYLTYPKRNVGVILDALDFYSIYKNKSMLCKEPVASNPYLCMYNEKESKGTQIIKHNLYRRQDYKPVFEISHYIGIFEAGEIKKLNKNLYNKNTIYFPIERVVDIDYQGDLIL